MTVARRGPVPDRTRADEVRSRRARVEAVVEPAPRERRPRPARTRPPRRRPDLALPRRAGGRAPPAFDPGGPPGAACVERRPAGADGLGAAERAGRRELSRGGSERQWSQAPQPKPGALPRAR